MSERRFRTITIIVLIWAALFLISANAVPSHAQNPLAQHVADNNALATAENDAKHEAGSNGGTASSDSHTGRLIVIGFVGGFVNRDDSGHPEVQLAAELRRRYPSSVYAEVYGNHHREAAHRQVLEWLDTSRDGILTTDEKQRARIIIYGHSWGASETVALARELEHRKIPVLLTIQVDSIAKLGEHDGLIPPNVANAVNFYQPDGLFHGCPEIAAEDPTRTRIIGNFRTAYSGHPITSRSSSPLARLFMKSHVQIEDDPSIWKQAAALIDGQMSQSRSIDQAQASGVTAVGP